MPGSTGSLGVIDLFDHGRRRLQDLLGAGWEVAAARPAVPARANLPRSVDVTAPRQVITVRNRQSGEAVPVLVASAGTTSPQTLRRAVAARLELMRELTGDAAVVLVAAWLSPHTRRVLDGLGYGYVDLTGNASVVLPRLGIGIHKRGAARNPTPSTSRWRQHLRGEKAGRLVRALVDVRPPYRGPALAQASGLSLTYVSRLLDALAEQGLIERREREVVRVDWPAVLRERGSGGALLRAHLPLAMTAPHGVRDVLQRIAAEESLGRCLAVTGPFAVAAVAPMMASGQLMIHVDDDSDEGLDWVRRSLGLRAAPAGGEVLLLRSAGSTAFIGRRLVDGIPYVALSQLALDCLGGVSRGPEVGEAVVEYMRRYEPDWRLATLEGWAAESR